jgi:hypothetical protein
MDERPESRIKEVGMRALLIALLVVASRHCSHTAATRKGGCNLAARGALVLGSDLVAQLSPLAPPGSRSEARMGRGDSATIDLAPFVVAGRIKGLLARSTPMRPGESSRALRYR